jgi:hypothetical protein
MANNPRWLDIVRHRIAGFRAPYLLIVQHHDIPATTLLAAPVTPGVPGDVDALAPRLPIDGVDHRARILDISAVPRRLIGETVLPGSAHADAVLSALDIILYGYPVGRPS